LLLKKVELFDQLHREGPSAKKKWSIHAPMLPQGVANV
jgi:hypothetical protein